MNLRIPAELKEALDAAALRNKRSLTAEVVDRLQSSFGRSESEVTWTKAFPEAATALAGERSFREAQEFLHATQMQATQLKDRVASLEAHSMGMEAQAVMMQREMLRVDADLNEADARKDTRTVSALLKQRQEMIALRKHFQVQAKAMRVAALEAKKQLELLASSEENQWEQFRPGRLTK